MADNNTVDNKNTTNTPLRIRRRAPSYNDPDYASLDDPLISYFGFRPEDHQRHNNKIISARMHQNKPAETAGESDEHNSKIIYEINKSRSNRICKRRFASYGDKLAAQKSGSHEYKEILKAKHEHDTVNSIPSAVTATDELNEVLKTYRENNETGVALDGPNFPFPTYLNTQDSIKWFVEREARMYREDKLYKDIEAELVETVAVIERIGRSRDLRYSVVDINEADRINLITSCALELDALNRAKTKRKSASTSNLHSHKEVNETQQYLTATQQPLQKKKSFKEKLKNSFRPKMNSKKEVCVKQQQSEESKTRKSDRTVSDRTVSDNIKISDSSDTPPQSATINNNNNNNIMFDGRKVTTPSISIQTDYISDLSEFDHNESDVEATYQTIDDVFFDNGNATTSAIANNEPSCESSTSQQSGVSSQRESSVSRDTKTTESKNSPVIRNRGNRESDTFNTLVSRFQANTGEEISTASSNVVVPQHQHIEIKRKETSLTSGLQLSGSQSPLPVRRRKKLASDPGQSHSNPHIDTTITSKASTTRGFLSVSGADDLLGNNSNLLKTGDSAGMKKSGSFRALGKVLSFRSKPKKHVAAPAAVESDQPKTRTDEIPSLQHSQQSSFEHVTDDDIDDGDNDVDSIDGQSESEFKGDMDLSSLIDFAAVLSANE